MPTVNRTYGPEALDGSATLEVTFQSGGLPGGVTAVWVSNLAPAFGARLYVTIDETDPTPGDDGTYCVLPGESVKFSFAGLGGVRTVRLLGNGQEIKLEAASS